MQCPNCGSDKQIINDIDSSVCCSQCGLVHEQNILSTESTCPDDVIPLSIAEAAEKTNKRETEFVNQFRVTAAYFEFPQDLITSGKQIIKENVSEFSNRYVPEVAICVAFLVSRKWKPEWDLNDFIENFTLPLDIIQVRKAYFTITKRQPSQVHIWKRTSEQVDYFIDRVYTAIINQLNRVSRVGKKEKQKKPFFTIEQLAEKTKALIELGELYGLNLAQKARPTITVTAILSGLCLFVELGIAGRKRGRISCTHHLRLADFLPLCFSGLASFLSRYAEYVDFLFACAKNIGWIKGASRKYVHYYLSDILETFGQQDKEEPPMMTLRPEQYTIGVFRKSKELHEQIENDLRLVQEHIENRTRPDSKKDPTKFALYKLKSYGFKDQDILNWTPGYIRSMANSLQFREDYGDVYCFAQANLDRKEVDEQDMNDEEIELYLY
ncbi:uncharacterized protein BX663DRAFT_583956 [Cokeromyces recurvatus]|uniref:uncharacterized protein n=1 Tax=Cokeromyces recurvatus TaxID=90255 RepID=UPI002220A763|nr:uncharacterized protein BX663DRAFT_583956 [Cokeromyces recurvatus]KAI7905706.1 hypothetical protein BX663DRAFT_583956 [Cokeromyces recurvatus]